MDKSLRLASHGLWATAPTRGAALGLLGHSRCFVAAWQGPVWRRGPARGPSQGSRPLAGELGDLGVAGGLLPTATPSALGQRYWEWGLNALQSSF